MKCQSSAEVQHLVLDSDFVIEVSKLAAARRVK